MLFSPGRNLWSSTAFPGTSVRWRQSLYGLSSPLGTSLEASSVREGPVIQLTRQLTCLEDAAIPADNNFVSHVMNGFVAQASSLSPRLWPCFSDSYLCPGHPLPAEEVSSCQCCTFSLGASPGLAWEEGQRASPPDWVKPNCAVYSGLCGIWLLSTRGRQIWGILFVSQTVSCIGSVEALV